MLHLIPNAPQDFTGRDEDIYNAGVINFIVRDVASFSTDYSVRIHNFLNYYMGSESQPMPFGGRDDTIQYLDSWLDDPHQPPCLLLAAPAGRGKSALLVRWAERLMARKDLVVIFIPVSIRFRTNLEGFVLFALGAGLATFFHEDMPDIDLPPEILRDRIARYFSNPQPEERRLLIVIDGVDEAAGWEIGSDLLTNCRSNGIRIVVSARYLAGDIDARSWMSRLGWDLPSHAGSIDLNPLDESGVMDVMNRSGLEKIAPDKRIEMAREIYRLSQGDPLLVQLYVEDLWSKRNDSMSLCPEDLPGLEPGLKGYLGRWWIEQCKRWEILNNEPGARQPTYEPAVRELINLFACAFGPLSRVDVLSLVSPDLRLDDYLLKDALKSLDRIIIGDGLRQDYVFSHPRFASYFYDDFSDVTKKDIEMRFVSYGENSLIALGEGSILPENISPYLLQYLGGHMERAGLGAERLLSMVSIGWMEAWVAYEGAYSGFLNDVSRAWIAAEAEDQKRIDAGGKVAYMGGTVRCALCHSSVNSLSKNIPPDLLLSLASSNILRPDQSLAYARQNPDLVARVVSLYRLSSFFVEPRRTEVANEALEAARNIKDDIYRLEALAGLAFLSDLPSPLKEERLAEVLEQGKKIENTDARLEFLVEFAGEFPNYLKTDVLAEALNLARKIEAADSKVEHLAAIAAHLEDPMKTTVLKEALKAARRIEDDYSRGWALGQIAPGLSDDLLMEIIKEITEIEETIEPYLQFSLLMQIISFHPSLDEALKAARKIEYDIDRIRALVAVAGRLPDPGKSSILSEAIKTARAIKKNYSRADSLLIIAQSAANPLKAKVLAEALEAARGIRGKTLRETRLASVARQISDPEAAIAIAREIGNAANVTDAKIKPLDEPICSVENGWDRESRLEIFTSSAQNLAEPRKTEVLNEALRFAREIGDKDLRIRLLATLSPHLANGTIKEDILKKAIKAAMQTKSEYLKVDLLEAISPNLRDLKTKDILNESLDVARGIQDGYCRAAALYSIASCLSDPLRTDIMKAALCAAREIKFDLSKIMALSSIAPSLEESMKTEILKETLDAAKQIDYMDSRAEALACIASLLPDNEVPQSSLSSFLKSLAFWRPPNASKKDILREALKAARRIECEDSKVEALTAIAPHLPIHQKANVLKEALEIAGRIEDDYSRVEALAYIVPHLDEPQKTEILKEALEIVRQIGDDDLRREAPGKIIASFSDPKEALLAAGDIEDIDSRAEALAKIVPQLIELPDFSLYSLWRKNLAIVCLRTREDMMRDLEAFAPIIAILCDHEVMAEVTHSIEDVCNWWP